MQVLAAPGVSPAAPEGVGAAPPVGVVGGGVGGTGTMVGGVVGGVGVFGGGVWAETQCKKGKNTRASTRERGDISVHRRGSNLARVP